MEKKLLNIHYLRGIASLLIILLHYNFVLPEPLQRYVTTDGLGVDIFFIISGFIITYATQHQESFPSFCTKRFFRIMPVFFLVWLVASIFVFNEYPIKELIKALMLFHVDYNFSSAPAYGFNIMGTPWTLTYEVYFYIIFGISMTISHKNRIRICGISILAFVTCIQLIYNHSFSINSQVSANLYVSNWWLTPLKILSTTILFEFIAGMFLAGLYIKHKDNFSLQQTCYIIFFSIILLIIGFSEATFSKVGFDGTFWIALPIFMSAIALDKYGFKPDNMLLNNAANISYSLYIIHFPVMIYFRKNFFIKHHFSDLTRIALYIIMILLCYALANIVHKTIEKPFLRLSRRILANKNQTLTDMQN